MRSTIKPKEGGLLTKLKLMAVLVGLGRCGASRTNKKRKLYKLTEIDAI